MSATMAESRGPTAARPAGLVSRRQMWDAPLLLVVLALLVGGLIVVLDASSARALESSTYHNDPFYLFNRQVRWVAVGLGALFLAMNVPYWKWRRYAWPAFLISVIMLVVVLVAGREINGSKRWLFVGGLGFQPSEIAKLSLVLALAAYYETGRKYIKELRRGFIPPVLATLVLGGLIALEDLGTAIVVVGTGLCMVFVMGAARKHIAALCVVLVLGAVAFIRMEDYRQARIDAWLALLSNPTVQKESLPAGKEGKALAKALYQPSQGLIALGSGGLSGRGLMQGAAKHLYLPAEHTDYIFATMGEEIGLIGCLLVLGCFAILVVRGLTVAHRMVDTFGSLLALGLTSMLGIQAILNVGVVTCLLPCTGVPLPFISYGGTSLVFMAAAVGVILNISRYPHRRNVIAERSSRASSSRGRGDGGPRIPGA